MLEPVGEVLDRTGFIVTVIANRRSQGGQRTLVKIVPTLDDQPPTCTDVGRGRTLHVVRCDEAPRVVRDFVGVDAFRLDSYERLGCAAP
jgi:hypothetical protein